MGPNNSEHVGGGIKLFGTTISVDKSAIKKEQIKVDDHDGDDDDQDRDRAAEMKKVIACPRCKSVETKFCYFNNYNVNQPRHFCKGCQRYWTAGGALRNVPVGAGRRKPKPPCHGALFFHDWSSSSFPLPNNKRRRTDASSGHH